MTRTNVLLVFCVFVLFIPCSTFASKRLNELELAHREASKEWARTLGESAEASLRVKRYKAAHSRPVSEVSCGLRTILLG